MERMLGLDMSVRHRKKVGVSCFQVEHVPMVVHGVMERGA
jgi:hypothetical protein